MKWIDPAIRQQAWTAVRRGKEAWGWYGYGFGLLTLAWTAFTYVPDRTWPLVVWAIALTMSAGGLAWWQQIAQARATERDVTTQNQLAELASRIEGVEETMSARLTRAEDAILDLYRSIRKLDRLRVISLIPSFRFA